MCLLHVVDYVVNHMVDYVVDYVVDHQYRRDFHKVDSRVSRNYGEEVWWTMD